MSKELDFSTRFLRDEGKFEFKASEDNIRLCRDNEPKQTQQEGAVNNYSARLVFNAEGVRVPGEAKVRYLLINHTVNGSVEDAVGNFQQNGTSCHYMIAEDGAIENIVDPQFRAYFAGRAFVAPNSKLNPSSELEKDLNSTSVSIMLVNNGKSAFAGEQVASFAKLAEQVIDENPDITATNVLGSSEVNAKHCGINPHFPWKKLADAKNLYGIKYNLGVYPAGEYDFTASAPLIIATTDGQPEPATEEYQATLKQLQKSLEDIGYYIPENEKASGESPASFGQYTKAAFRAFKVHYENETVVSQLQNEAGEVTAYTSWWGEMSSWMETVRQGDLDCMQEVANLLGASSDPAT